MRGGRGEGRNRSGGGAPAYVSDIPARGTFVVLYCNFRSLAFLGLLGSLVRQLKIGFIATLLSAAKELS